MKQGRAEQRVRELAEERELTLTEGGGRNFEVSVEAPRGRHFVAEDLHERVFAVWNGGAPRDAWAEALAFLRSEESAIEPCGQDCEWW